MNRGNNSELTFTHVTKIMNFGIPACNAYGGRGRSEILSSLLVFKSTFKCKLSAGQGTRMQPLLTGGAELARGNRNLEGYLLAGA
jgi:hypothetical protein